MKLMRYLDEPCTLPSFLVRHFHVLQVWWSVSPSFSVNPSRQRIGMFSKKICAAISHSYLRI